ncbi:uncharacterized protein MELLADRAFT_92137 [Melampsora larici-populina 98AG31]|uniref:Uncharacterized protein n=1 Tax=Melampsora larici-populina (strain 98AG31 / pathotype 3-4-7) TaxID=747676 RepID=F4S1M7_MELLP|nr:uncharacterized protein MELLADRAFT_92137 [Melampsora larici-populina 98AG31]EGG01479.1 hypothetical protein MELLADRAFT_92137 [Melampsora larici-populina 98AG31]
MRFVLSAQATSDEYFVQTTSGPNEGQWTCKLCTARTFKDKIKHSKLKTHIDQVRVELERVSASEPAAAPQGLGSRTALANTFTSSGSMFPEEENTPADIQDNDMDIFEDGLAESSDELASLYDPSHPIDFGFNHSRSRSSLDLEDFLDNSSDAESDSRPTVELQSEPAATDTWLPWYPLRKAEHAAALLMLGTGRNLMSTAEYNRIRSILKRILEVDLPDLGHIKNVRTDLKDRLGLRVLESISPLGNPCFTLSVCDIISQELSNPEVGPHIEFFPEKDEGVTVDRYSQSKKWREDLPPSLRVPMVNVEGEHFYIYEPTQLEDSRVVVPIFFYKDELAIRAKCLKLEVVQGTCDFLIPAKPRFDSDIFLDVNVQTFATSFLQIELWNGQKWSELLNTRLLPEQNLLL